jgi:hypothetical protein
MKPIGELSASELKRKKEYANLEKLNVVRFHYIVISWQRFRYGAMACILILFLLAAHFQQVSLVAAQEIAKLLPNIDQKNASALFPASLFFIYVITSQSWSWYKLLRTRGEIHAIDELHSRYVFLPIR